MQEREELFRQVLFQGAQRGNQSLLTRLMGQRDQVSNDELMYYREHPKCGYDSWLMLQQMNERKMSPTSKSFVPQKSLHVSDAQKTAQRLGARRKTLRRTYDFLMQKEMVRYLKWRDQLSTEARLRSQPLVTYKLPTISVKLPSVVKDVCIDINNNTNWEKTSPNQIPIYDNASNNILNSTDELDIDDTAEQLVQNIFESKFGVLIQNNILLFTEMYQSLLKNKNATNILFDIQRQFVSVFDGSNFDLEEQFAVDLYESLMKIDLLPESKKLLAKIGKKIGYFREEDSDDSLDSFEDSDNEFEDSSESIESSDDEIDLADLIDSEDPGETSEIDPKSEHFADILMSTQITDENRNFYLVKLHEWMVLNYNQTYISCSMLTNHLFNSTFLSEDQWDNLFDKSEDFWIFLYQIVHDQRVEMLTLLPSDYLKQPSHFENLANAALYSRCEIILRYLNQISPSSMTNFLNKEYSYMELNIDRPEKENLFCYLLNNMVLEEELNPNLYHKLLENSNFRNYLIKQPIYGYNRVLTDISQVLIKDNDWDNLHKMLTTYL